MAASSVGFAVRVLGEFSREEQILVIANPDIRRCAWALGLRICSDGEGTGAPCPHRSPYEAGHSHIPADLLETNGSASLRPEARALVELASSAVEPSGEAIIRYHAVTIL